MDIEMKSRICFVYAILLLIPTLAYTQKYKDTDGKIKVALVKNQYKGDRRGSPTSEGPDILEQSGLKESLAKIGGSVERISNVQLSPEEERQYGVRNKFGFSTKHLADFVAANEKEGYFNVGLLNNCTSLLGMLAGLQHSGPGMRPLRIGMIFVEAHGD